MKSAVEARRSVLEAVAEDLLLERDRVDITLPKARVARGTHHLLTQTTEEACDIFRSIGYQVAEGPEIELAWYNFDALNTPPTHPARFDRTPCTSSPSTARTDPAPDELLLRTHTSPMQIRYMEKHDPPAYIVVPGRVFRADTWDATHSPVFHQIEGLAVDSDITFSDLKGTLAHFVTEFFGPNAKSRFIPISSPSPSRQPNSWCGSTVPGWRCSGAGSSIPTCSRRWDTTPMRSPASHLAWAWSAWRWSNTASPTSATSTRTTCGCWDSFDEGDVLVHSSSRRELGK